MAEQTKNHPEIAPPRQQDAVGPSRMTRQNLANQAGPQKERRGIESVNVDDHSDSASDDYDHIDVDPDTLVGNFRKGMEAAASTTSTYVGRTLAEQIPTDRPIISGQAKRNSIQIRLERTPQKGRYLIRADDPEIRNILRRGMEREETASDGSKKDRFRLRNLVFTRQFTTFDRQNPASADSPFFGFFTLFWIAMVLLFCQVSLRNWRDYGSILGRNQIMKLMFSHDVLVLAVTDGVMCAACFEGYIMQQLVRKGVLNWARSGWIVQNAWQAFYLASIVGWTYFREWPWTHTVFAVLHGLVFLMKQHSYNFYNGYLSGVWKRRELLEQKLAQLEAMDPQVSPHTSQGSFQDDVFASGRDAGFADSQLNDRRPSLGPRTSTDLTGEKSDVATIASAIEAGASIDENQLKAFTAVVRYEIDDLTKELNGKSVDGRNAYPNNLTMYNLAEFICFPTLVYELEYPRQERINWWYVMEKTTATFGVLCVMMVISQAFIYPPVARTVEMKAAGVPIDERWREFPFIVSEMLFPLLIEQLLTWYLIWECILNVIAELTGFADRGFYGPWWNSITWDEYARDWNRPVHNFLLRHVYHSSISTLHLTRNAATFATFLLSALVHEMVMAVMFRKVRGYLFCMQLMQMPLIMVSRSKLLRGRAVLGNVIFWFGLFIGPSFLTGLYLVI